MVPQRVIGTVHHNPFPRSWRCQQASNSIASTSALGDRQRVAMHYSAWLQGYAFFSMLSSLLLRDEPVQIIDIGSYDFNGELRSALYASDLINNHKVTYTGIDVAAGPNVDVVVGLKDKTYPFPDEHFDVVTSSSALEHDPRFWMTYLKMLRVLKPGGFLYISVPHAQAEHRYPVDCWRFYSDSGEALADWGRENNIAVDLVYVNKIAQSDDPKDYAGIDYLMIFYKHKEGDSQSAVAEVVSHFSHFMAVYDTTRTMDPIAITAYVRQRIKAGQDLACTPAMVVALNGTQFTVDAQCELTQLIEQ